MGPHRFLRPYLTTADLDSLEASLRRHRDFERRTREQTKTRLERLEAELARVALLLRTLADLSLAKGFVTKEELAQHMLAADLADGAKDERLDPRAVMPGVTKAPESVVARPGRRPRSRKRRK